MRENNSDEDDRRFYTAGFVGVWTEWVEAGMETDSSDDFIRIGNVLTKMTLEAYRRQD